MITPIWGDRYIERWLDLCIASLRSADNFSYLNAHCDFDLAIVTRHDDIARLQANPRLVAALAGIRLRFVPLDELLPPQVNTSYGVPLTAGYAKAILDLGDELLGAYVILLNADSVLTPGSMKSIVEKMYEGYGIITATSVRTSEDEMRAVLQRYVDANSGILSVPPRTMVRHVFDHLHNHAAARIVNEPKLVDATYYSQIYWRVSDDCLAMRGFLLHPFCFRVDRVMSKVLCPVDYGFITEFCPDGRFCVVGDSDAFVMVELQQPHSESHWLRPAPQFATKKKRLSFIASEIVAHTATWATAEHLRSATETLYYHTDDLPSDLDRCIAPFRAFVDNILLQLPKPVPHIGHWHWLPAVRIYREDMKRGGAPWNVALLDDPRNDETTAQAQPTTSATAPPDATPPASLPAAVHCARIGAMIEDAIAEAHWMPFPDVDMLVIGDAAGYVPKVQPQWRVESCTDPSGPDQRRDFNIGLTDGLIEDGGDDLVVCAGIGFLPLWDRLQQDLDRFLAQRRRVVFAFIRQGYEPLSFSGHTYLLSLLLTRFPATKFDASLRVYDSRPSTDDPPMLRRWRRLKLRLGFPPPPPPANSLPTDFSALIVTAQRKGRQAHPRLPRLRRRLKARISRLIGSIKAGAIGLLLGK